MFISSLTVDKPVNIMLLLLFSCLIFTLGLLARENECSIEGVDNGNCIEENMREDGQIELKNWATSIWKVHFGNGHEYVNSPTIFTSSSICKIPSPPMVCSGGSCDTPMEGIGVIENSDGTKYYGNWTSDGLMEGQGNITRPDGTVIKGQFRSGCLTGLVTSLHTDNRLVVTTYHHGNTARETPVWLLYPSGEGALYTTYTSGEEMSIFTGDQVVFLYPDYKTVLVGSFLSGSMVDTVEGKVNTISLSGVPRVEVVEVADQWFKRDTSTSNHLSSYPLVRDPYETKMVKVDTSNIPGAGMGVFTNRFVQSNTIIGYFNGVHRHREDVFSEGVKSEYLVEGSHENEMLDIPPEFRSWDNYKASTGHLVNHGELDNVDYVDCLHPRFGNILCVMTTRDIESGTELLVKYDVAVDDVGFKRALKMALEVGHLLSGKSRKDFVREAKPYLQVVSDMVNLAKKDFLNF